MGSDNSKKEILLNGFSDIVKKAYDRGINDQGVTVHKLIEDLKIDLIKLKA
jgi:hypothetical protein